ncbi:fasciclin-like arabinogalactan protein 14 [Abrus precatorius]|uniref:Fasciclin-like arabinogalactan protein 14 n=1 Tax=Abrus precatorius TaxID=3816 RepID=A0A8B8JQK0_ABRPR|nr:fasciclin-like arabinogalactan protein 14 [Abrus precatorius]
MSSKSSSFLCLALLLVFSSGIHAFDITNLLSKYPEFSTLNKYITETKLADQINSRNTITLLAVDNGAISSISSKSPEVIKAIISTNVILDYFDEKKLMEAQGAGQPLTTLFQASGLAVNQQGFIKVALIGEGEIAFGSAVSGAPIDAELVHTVTTEPYNISILKVTKLVIAPGVDSVAAQAPQGTSAPAKSAKAPVSSTQDTKAPSPVASTQDAKAPVASTKDAKAPVASTQDAKAPSKTATSPSPSGESDAESPVAAEAPDSTATSPTVSEAPAPGPIGDEAPAADSSPSASSTIKMGLGGTVMAFASLMIVL